jgi:DNA polymerase-3 subunit delta
MKHAGAKALAFAEKPPAKPRAALLFGADSGLVASAADQLTDAWLPKGHDPLNYVKLTEDDLKRDHMLLVDELVARSLMGGDRLVRVRIERETSAKSIIEALGEIESGVLVPEAAFIVEAGDLGRTSKLRSAFEDANKAAALHLFADDEAGMAELLQRKLTSAGIAIEPEALAAFAAELPGDRRLANSETEKLELYATGLGRPVSLADIALLSPAEQPRGADDAADAAILGEQAVATQSINRFLDAGGNPISAMRTLHFRLLRVADAIAQGATNGGRLRPPIFDKEWPPFQRAMKDWPADKLNRAVAALYESEKQCKQAQAPAEAIIRRLIDRIASRKV